MPLGLNLKPQFGWTVGDHTETKSFNPGTATLEDLIQSYATLLAALQDSLLFPPATQTFTFNRPDGTSVYKRPGGTDNYLRA